MLSQGVFGFKFLWEDLIRVTVTLFSAFFQASVTLFKVLVKETLRNLVKFKNCASWPAHWCSTSHTYIFSVSFGTEQSLLGLLILGKPWQSDFAWASCWFSRVYITFLFLLNLSILDNLKKFWNLLGNSQISMDFVKVG